MTLLIGGRATAYLEINAVDGFVPERGTVTLDSRDGLTLPATGVGDLRKGRLRLTLAAPATLSEERVISMSCSSGSGARVGSVGSPGRSA